MGWTDSGNKARLTRLIKNRHEEKGSDEKRGAGSSVLCLSAGYLHLRRQGDSSEDLQTQPEMTGGLREE